jgi:hypothetical protein
VLDFQKRSNCTLVGSLVSLAALASDQKSITEIELLKFDKIKPLELNLLGSMTDREIIVTSVEHLFSLLVLERYTHEAEYNIPTLHV